MAKLENKGTNPFVALLANFCCFGVLGYVLIGQTSKAVMVFVVTAVLSFLGIGFIVALLALVDVYQVAEAIQKGEDVDENEYKLEILHSLMKLVHKDAVFKKLPG